MAATEKYSKQDVDYGPGDIDGQHCGACEHFKTNEANRCEIVYGKIRSGGWCRKWVAKGTAKKAEKETAAEKKEGEDAA